MTPEVVDGLGPLRVTDPPSQVDGMPDETTQPVATEQKVTVEVSADEVAAVEQVAPDAKVEGEVEGEAGVKVAPDTALTPAPTPAPDPAPIPPSAPLVVGLRFTASVDTPDRRYEPGEESTFDELSAAHVDVSTLIHLGVVEEIHEHDAAPEGNA